MIEAEAWNSLLSQAEPWPHFKPVLKSHYCQSEGRLGCDCLPCCCPADFLEQQKHLSRLQRLVNRARAACADWLELVARRIR